MSEARQTQIMEQVGTTTYRILTESDTFPFVPTIQTIGLAIINTGGDLVTVVVNDGDNNITINCPLDARSYSGNFKRVASINVTAGTNYQIELRRV